MSGTEKGRPLENERLIRKPSHLVRQRAVHDPAERVRLRVVRGGCRGLSARLIEGVEGFDERQPLCWPEPCDDGGDLGTAPGGDVPPKK